MVHQLSRLQRCLIVLMLALTLVPFSAGAQGNSDAAHACQDDGYLYLVGVGGETFSNVGQCVRFAAQGGTFDDGTDVLEGSILIPAGFSATLSNVEVSACNTLSFHYTLNDGAMSYFGGNEGCNNVTLDSLRIGPVDVDSVLVLYLTDHSCGDTVYDSGGNHATLIENAPVYEVDIADAADVNQGCYLLEAAWPFAGSPDHDGNLSLTVTVHP